MINLSLLLVPESTVSIEALWERVLRSVVNVLHRSGYVVDPDIACEAIDEHGFTQQYQIVPGPATLTGARDDRGSGSVEIVLCGQKFGLADALADKDAVLWDRLDALRHSLDEAFFLASLICDPSAAA